VKLVIAVPTKGRRGLDDIIDAVFARAPYFTIIEASDRSYRVRKIIKNEFTDLSHGVGPIIVKLLKDVGVDAIAAPKVGCGVEELIRELGLKHYSVGAGARVGDVIKSILMEFESTQS